MNTLIKNLLITALLGLVSLSTHAAIITYEYSGSWASTNGLDPQEIDGANFDFTFLIDSNTAASGGGDGWAYYTGEASIVVSDSPGDINGEYSQQMNMFVRTDYNHYGTITFGNFNDPSINNTGNFIFMNTSAINLGVISDTALPIGNFTDDIAFVWNTSTLGGGNYSASITNLSASVVPVPAAVWLFGSGLIGLVGFARVKTGAEVQV